MAAESANQPLHGGDGSNVLPAKESSQLRTEFSDVGIVNSDHEIQDVEVRKLFAVKLVREAIEKILLPEVQDQTYDNQSTIKLKHSSLGIQEETVFCLNSKFPISNFLRTIGNKETNTDYRSVESKNLIQDGNGLLTEDTIASAVHCGTLEPKKIVRLEADQDAAPELRHVVSGIAAKVGSQLLDGTDDDEVENCNELSKISNGDYFPKSGYDLGKENRVRSHLNSAFTKTDAIKLVQEVVDEILLPEVQDDSSDTQSVTSDFGPDKEISECLDQEKETQCTTCEGGISVGQKGLEQKSARKPKSLKSKN
ncbi:Hypothetical predicted protein [Olea europaea subsp. europaea]|uniref:Uncharacterized protein n=1 Tax=Olea europaea subsp. europaea TaxID=158383 RepID=A0A8S0UWX7_OLEEU|nr:Hypothetical predicted protein [Olea europaea subsp. europaea]